MYDNKALDKATSITGLQEQLTSLCIVHSPYHTFLFSSMKEREETTEVITSKNSLKKFRKQTIKMINVHKASHHKFISLESTSVIYGAHRQTVNIGRLTNQNMNVTVH